MTTRYVALLRAVNVAGHGTIKMADLRASFDSLGHTDVTTYIQSGNVVFTSAAPVVALALEHAVAAELGMTVEIVLRTSVQLKRVVQRNPFPDVDTSKLHVGFMSKRPSAAVVGQLDLPRFDPEAVVVAGSELYLHLPNGMGRATLPDHLRRSLDALMTIRNWNTVTKLVELVDLDASAAIQP
jgi:uncharacterized protein (DUF1697 family)